MFYFNKLIIIPVFTFLIAFCLSAQVLQTEVDYYLSSGLFNGTNLTEPKSLYSTVINHPNSKWLRIKFGSVNLGRNSYIIVRSLEDGLWQKFNSVSIEQWYYNTAYFNGSSLEVSLFVGPGDDEIFFNTSSLIVGEGIAQYDDICGDDDRVSSQHNAIGRIVTSNQTPYGTGWILFDGRIVSAGHVVNGQSGLIIEFNVPNSDPNGNPKHPSPDDQYSVNHNTVIFNDDGQYRDDWAVMSVFPNSNTGLLPKEAQNAFFQVEQNTTTQDVRVTGYGTDDGSANKTQQTEEGTLSSVVGTNLWYVVDTRPGNSGSPVINESNGKAIGIHTEGRCFDLGNNIGTSFTNTSLWNEINPEIDFVVHQKKNTGSELVGTYIGRWIGDQTSGSFQNYSVTTNGALIEDLEYGDYETFRGKQEKTDNTPYEKFNTWTVENTPSSNITNHQKFLIDYPMSEMTSQFNLTFEGVTIKNSFPEVAGLNPSDDVIEFSDPWLIDYEDPQYNGTNYRNRGMSALMKQRNSPFYPNYDSYYGTDKYFGVFLNQNFTGPVYYSVKATSPQNIYLSQTGRYHNFYFQNWSGTSASFQDANLSSTGVVFTNSNAVAQANLKGTQLSNNQDTYTNASQRKFMQTPDGVKHLVYESMGYVWYEISTDGGNTWIINNGGKPLSSNQSKNPSLGYYANEIAVVWQENNGGYFDIKIAVFYSANYSSSEFGTVSSDPYLTYSHEANPVIGRGYGGTSVIVWAGSKVNWFGLYEQGLICKYGAVSSNGFYWYSETLLPNTDADSKNPTVAADYTLYANPFYYHLAWEQKLTYTSAKINYYALYADGNYEIQSTPLEDVSTGGGYSKNYNPLITIRKAFGWEYLYFTWLGYRKYVEDSAPLNKDQGVSMGETKVLLRHKRGLWSTFGVYGTEVKNHSMNTGTEQMSRQDPLGFCWSQGSSYPYTHKMMKAPVSLDFITLGTGGKDLQVNNSTNFTDMHAMSFQSHTSPYSFSLSANFSSANKENTLMVYNGREGIIRRGAGQFYFAIGDIIAEGEEVEFIEIPDSIEFNSYTELNTYLITKPFTVSSTSSLLYGIQYGITDSLLCTNALQQGREIDFRVELIDANTLAILGVFDEVTFDENNILQYANIGYEVDLTGIGNRTVQLRLVSSTNSEFQYSLSDRKADQQTLGKNNYTSTTYQGNLPVVAYQLEQNFPNPFNPSTVIKYQIPNDGFVSVKVYDIIGREVATLINEQQSEGRYEINFDASTLSSGVYLYRIQAGDYVATKKMLLLK